MSDSLRPHESQHARFPCPLPTIRDYSCPLSHWCHSTISILCHPLLLLPSIFPSIRVFSNESDLCIRWTKYWSFSLNISPSNEHPGLISFRMDWLDLLAVQWTLKNDYVLLPGISHEWTEKPVRLQSMGSQKVKHNLVTSLSYILFILWRKN